MKILLMLLEKETNKSLRVLVNLSSSYKIMGIVVPEMAQKSLILPFNEYLNINFRIYRKKKTIL